MTIRKTPSFLSASMLSLSLAFVAPFALPTLAAAADKAVETTTSTLVKNDSDFLIAAIQGGMIEVKNAQLVIKRNVTGPALDFAKKMVSEHEKVNDELTKLASKKGLTLPTTLNEDMQKCYDELAKTDDAKLAKAYIADQVKGHKKAVSALKEAAEDSKDVDVKAFAATHLPHFQAHLDEAKRIADAQ